MALDEQTEALMLAYVYGELSASAARAFEQRVQAEPELRAELEGLRATRDLLGKDARYGAESGIDAPPPHLVDAILSAEPLARPAEIRQAALARASTSTATSSAGSGPFTARLARWLLGGGLVAGAAATALVLVVSRDAPAPQAVYEKSAMGDAAAGGPAPALPVAPTDGAAARPADAEAPAADMAPEPEPPAQALAQAGSADKESVSTAKALQKPAATLAKDEAVAAKGDQARRMENEMPSLERGLGAAPPPPAKSSVAPATRADRDDDGWAGDAAGAAATAPMARGPAAPPSVAAREELAEGRRLLVDKKKAARAADEPSSQSAARARQVELANLALMTGQRELERRNFFAALDELAKAEQLDPDHALGATPVLGQMRALLGLRRPVDAIQASRRLLRRDLREVDVVAALRLGAETAEQAGDVRNARDLWLRLAESPSERARAQAALDRMSRARAQADATAESKAASKAASKAESKAESKTEAAAAPE